MGRIRHNLKLIKRYSRDWWWQIWGTKISNPLLPEAASSIVFICKGNICRSVFAQYRMNQNLKKNGKPTLMNVSSAGLKARIGTTSPATAVQVAKGFGINMERHRSIVLTDDIVETADMLIAMEPSQVITMQKRYPHKNQHIFLLTLFENGWRQNYFGWHKFHIQDPYGKEPEDFLNSFERVSRCVDGLLVNLKMS